MRPATLLLSVLLFATTAPRVEAQRLDNQWFKLTASLVGTGFNEATNESETGKVAKFVRYVRFDADEVEGPLGVTYTLSVYSPTTDGGWTDGFSGTVGMLDAEETYVFSAEINMPTEPVTVMEDTPNVASVIFNGPCKIKLKGEELKSAKITSVGTLGYFTKEDGFAFHGKATLTLTRVDVEKLPFPVATLTVAKPQPEPAKAEPKTDTKTEEAPEEQPGKP